jgi:Uma2 family endonuclease
MAKIIWDPPEIEYIDGHPYPKVSPKRTHAVVQLAIAMILQRCAAKAGIVGPEWRFKLAPGTELVPDIAYVSYARLRCLTDAEAEEPPFAPDIAAEVRSPSHRRALAAKKIQQYLTHGGCLVLDIDPYARVVYAYSGGADSPNVYRAGERFYSNVVPWLEFDIDELFANIDIPR